MVDCVLMGIALVLANGWMQREPFWIGGAISDAFALPCWVCLVAWGGVSAGRWGGMIGAIFRVRPLITALFQIDGQVAALSWVCAADGWDGFTGCLESAPLRGLFF